MDKNSELKKRVLLSFVGNRDPYPSKWERIYYFLKTGRKNEGSILTICRHKDVSPDYVYLFPSKDKPGVLSSTEGNGKLVKGILEDKFKMGDNVHIIPLDIDNANDLQEINKSFKDNIAKAFTSLKDDHGLTLEECDFYLNISSGTQQMNQVAQLYLLPSKIDVQLYMCNAPKFTQSDADRVRKTNAPFVIIEEAILLKSIYENTDYFDFHVMIEECKRLAQGTKLQERKQASLLLALILRAYKFVDYMQYQEAYVILNDTLARPEKIKIHLQIELGIPMGELNEDIIRQILSNTSLRNLLSQQKEFLNVAKSSSVEESLYNLVDLYYNIHRAFKRGNYADVLARFWRLREGMLIYRLREKGIKTRDLDNSDLDSLKRLDSSPYKRVLYNDFGGKWMSDGKWTFNNKANIGTLSDILKDVFSDRELDTAENSCEVTLDRLRDLRNQSYIAHGMSPVSYNDIEAICQANLEAPKPIGEVILSLVSNSQTVKEQYPFQAENLKTLVNALIRF